MPASFWKFLVVGGIGFIIDSGLTMGLIQLGMSPFFARPPAILSAMIFTWLANRRFAFNVTKARSIPEAARYSVVAAVAALLNYFIYSGLVMVSLSPFLSIATSTVIVAVFSYFGYKHIAFATSR